MRLRIIPGVRGRGRITSVTVNRVSDSYAQLRLLCDNGTEIIYPLAVGLLSDQPAFQTFVRRMVARHS